MHPARLVLRSLVQYRVHSVLTGLNVAVGMLLVSVVLQLRAATDSGLIAASNDYSLIVGPPGSRLELVLETLFHRGNSSGLMPYARYVQIKAHASTRRAVPLAFGDMFRGFRVVGTTPDAFVRDPQEPRKQPVLQAGRVFRHDEIALARWAAAPAGPGQVGSVSPSAIGFPEILREAVVGARVAKQLGIIVGDQIEPTHGTQSVGLAHREADVWTVVGIASPTHTARDSLVWINLESFLAVADHRGGTIAETGEAGISAVWVYPRAGVHKALLLGALNKYSQLQVADVATEVAGLLQLVGSANQLLLLVACLVVAVGVSSVALGVYGTVSARRRELALLRVLGAKRRTVVALVIAEAAVLTALGGLLGLLGAHGVLALSADFLEAHAAVRPIADLWLVGQWAALGAVVLAGALGGLLPALRAYREDAVAGLNAVV